MANVVAWPDPSVNGSGFVNLHYSMLDQKKPGSLIKGLGWPFLTVEKFVERAAWIANGHATMKDVWFCTSTQSKSGTNKHGKPKAVRFAHNAIAQKSIWIDLDVKDPANPDPKNDLKKYDTVADAVKAALGFAKVVGLPNPSAIVYSGNGVHFYWISKTALNPQDWQRYASGLKNLLLANNILCDAGITTDIARILRVPGTFNWKDLTKPKLVQLAPMPLKMYDFPVALDFLTQFAGPVTATPQAGTSLFADGATPDQLDSFKQKPILAASPDDTLQAGVDKHGDVLIQVEPIFKQCGFYKQALLTGGADYDNALWMYSVLGATFMENGNAVAHAVSKGHSSYSEADTQALYDRKLAERADRGIGYPSCSTIKGAGCKSCETCPLFAQGKSPLNIRPVVTATVNPAAGPSPAAVELKLPPEFEVNDEGIICKVVEKMNNGTLTMEMIPLFQCKLTHFWVQKNPDCLNYTVTVDKGFVHKASVPHTAMSAMGFKAFLAEQRTIINTDGAAYLEKFYLSMLSKLREAAVAQEAVPFGWYKEGKQFKGFVFGGNVMEDDGNVRPCGIGDAGIKANYTPTGDINDWFAAAKTVTDRKRPELTCIALMSFASPLLALEGHNSVMYSVWGTTAAGKSSAYQVGMSVWGHPKLTKGSEQSTRNSITTQMSEIRNLPFYWDEITDDKYRDTVAGIMHEASDGVQKARNISGQKSAPRGAWKLMLCAASNGSYREYLHQRNPNHAASIVRVLEWEVNKIDHGPGHLDDADATAILATLEDSYGHMGARYAQFLAVNHEAIQKEIRAYSKQFQAEVKGGGAERYWIAGCVLMILAAKYARQMGMDVDPIEIEEFMKKVYDENKMDRDQRGMADGKVNNTEAMLARYLKERMANERVIWTNYMHNVQGKPPKPVVVLRQPTMGRNTSGGVEVRCAVENREIVIAVGDFDPWLKDHKQSLKQIENGLKKDFGAIFSEKIRIGSGTIYASPLREPVIILPVKPGAALWDFLVGWSDPVAAAAAAEDKPEPAIETGFEIDSNGLATPASVNSFVKGATAGAAQ